MFCKVVQKDYLDEVGNKRHLTAYCLCNISAKIMQITYVCSYSKPNLFKKFYTQVYALYYFVPCCRAWLVYEYI